MSRELADIVLRHHLLHRPEGDVLRIDQPDHRRSDEPELLEGLGHHEPLALAEAYHRTIPAAHACARRLLAGSPEVEALLRTVYALLWSAPPAEPPLEAWIRSHSFQVGGDYLRERGLPPAVPSLGIVLPDLPAVEGPFLDSVERVVADLGEAERVALLRAHDAGIATAWQPDPGASGALERALLVLADAPADSPGAAACADLGGLGDLALGLLPRNEIRRLQEAIAAEPGCKERLRLLRQGRRRLEGLPPTPDMGQRILVSVLATSNVTDRQALPPAPLGPPPAGTELPPQATDGGVDQLTLPPPVADDGDRESQPATPVGGGNGELVASGGATGAVAATRGAPDDAPTTPASEPGPRSRPGDAEERSGHLRDPIEEERERSLTVRVARWAGYVLLLALGALVGLYAGSWFVGR